MFKPKAVYEAIRQADGRIVLVELVHADVPTLHVRRINGRLMGADVRLSPETIAAAVRAERNER